jgi:ligand-binding SRPBCC domain-containing protein
MRPGALIEYRLRLHRLPVSWLTRIEEWDTDPARPRFVDAQLTGPYRLWHHTHEFEPAPGGGTLMRDTVRYALPLGPLGALAHALLVRRDVRRIFDFRAQAIPRVLTAP